VWTPESTARTDREPIARRFPGLGAFREVRWVGGTVETLDPADAARLAAPRWSATIHLLRDSPVACLTAAGE
jgi:hypothetical protein